MRKALLVLVLVIVVVVGGGVFWVASQGEETLRAAAEEHGPTVVGAPVTLAGVAFSPFRGTASLSGLAIGNPQGFSETEALKFGGVGIALEPLSVLSDVVRISEIRIDAPEIRIEPGKGGTNLQAIQRNIEAFTGPTDETAKTKAVQIQDFYLTDAKIVVGSSSIGFSDQTLALADIHLEDIGGTEGIAPSQAAHLVFDALMPQVQKALASQAGQQLMAGARERLGDIEGALEKRLDEEVSKLPEGVGGEAGKALKEGIGGLLGGGKQEEEADKEGGGD